MTGTGRSITRGRRDVTRKGRAAGKNVFSEAGRGRTSRGAFGPPTASGIGRAIVSSTLASGVGGKWTCFDPFPFTSCRGPGRRHRRGGRRPPRCGDASLRRLKSGMIQFDAGEVVSKSETFHRNISTIASGPPAPGEGGPDLSGTGEGGMIVVSEGSWNLHFPERAQ